MKMTENQVIQYFEDFILPQVKETYEQDGITDGPARREAFNNMVDYLTMDNLVSEELANEICLPNHLDN